mgnify:CR=1 FL=1
MIVLTKNQSDIIDEMIEDPDIERLPELQWIALHLLRMATNALGDLTPTARAELEVSMDYLLYAIQWTVCSDNYHDRKELAKQCRSMADDLTREDDE